MLALANEKLAATGSSALSIADKDLHLTLIWTSSLLVKSILYALETCYVMSFLSKPVGLRIFLCELTPNFYITSHCYKT